METYQVIATIGGILMFFVGIIITGIRSDLSNLFTRVSAVEQAVSGLRGEHDQAMRSGNHGKTE